MIGFLTHHVAELLIWSISFCLLRVNLGGLHAPNHGLCIVLGTLIGSSSLLFSPLLEQHALLSLFLTITAALIAIVIAPVPHKNKMHVQVKRDEIKQKVVLIAILECAAVVGLYFVSPVIASYIASGLIMATVLAVAGLIWNPR
jgi:accessory gene regulator B